MMNENVARIDEQWNAVKPSPWGKGKHSAERSMLHDIVDDDEVIEAVTASTFFEPVVPLKRWLQLWGNTADTGVAIATSKRVLFVKSKIVGGDIAVELPYKSLLAIAETGGGTVSEGVHILRRKDDTWAIVQVSPESSQVNFSKQVHEKSESLANMAGREQVKPQRKKWIGFKN